MIPLSDKGAKKGNLFLFLVQIPQWSQRDLHGSTGRLSKYGVHHKDEVDLKSNYEVHKYKVTE